MEIKIEFTAPVLISPKDLEKVLEECKHSGQWEAIMSCGTPCRMKSI